MINKIICVIAFGLVAGIAPLGAQTTAAAAPAKVRGRIIVAQADGQVTVVSTVDGTSRALHVGDQISDQTQVVTADGSSVILVFSNGATVDVAANSTLNIEQFEQDPFATDIKVSDMKEEPGTSVTRLNLVKGDLVGKVVHLNVDRGSQFTVNTPVGAAGIRGTTFRIVYIPDPKTGTVRFEVTTSAGVVLFRGITSSSAIRIPAGQQVTATFDYTPPSPGNPNGSVPSTPVVTGTTDMPPAEQAEMDNISSAISQAVVNAVIPQSSSPGITGVGTTTTTTTTTNGTTETTILQEVNPTVVSPSS
jgi:hypothetical protein